METQTFGLESIQQESYIDVFERNLDSVTTLLSKLFSNEMSLYVKTRKFHWNVADENFKELQTLFEIQYMQLEHAIDLVAQRINDLGGKTIGIMQEFAKRSSISEVPGKYSSVNELVSDLLKNHERIINIILKNIDDCKNIYEDIDSADCLVGLMKEHEIVVWTLKKYLR